MNDINKETFKLLLDMKEAVFVPKFAAKLKKYNKIIYYAGLFFVVLMLLQSLVTLVMGGISMAFVWIIFAAFFFVIVRMFCEFLMDYNG